MISIATFWRLKCPETLLKVRSKRGPHYLSPSIPSPIGYQSSTLWVTVLLSKRQCVPALSYLQLQLNHLRVKGVSLFMSCTVLYRAVLIYLYVGCMCKRITLHKVGEGASQG